MPRTKKVKNEAKQAAMTNNTAIQAWRTAAKELGYLQAGKFVPIPSKNTPEYAAIKQRQLAILATAPKPPPPPPVPEATPTLPTLPPTNPFIPPIRAAAADYVAV